jgi:hypothetical protein
MSVVLSVTEEAERTISLTVSHAGFHVSKLEIDEVSILLSMDIVLDDKETRKATYVPFGFGRLPSAVSEVCEWIGKQKNGVRNGSA